MLKTIMVEQLSHWKKVSVHGPTKEQAIAYKWRKGDLGYKLNPVQHRLRKAFRNCESVLFLSLISRRTGKSTYWAIEAIETAIRNPGSRIRYGTAFQSDVAEFMLPIMEWVLSDCPDSLQPKFHTQGCKYIFPNGSEIKFVGLDLHPNSMRGSGLSLVIFDEAAFVSKLSYIYQSVIVPMLKDQPHLRVVMSSTPPETPDHDFSAFWQEALEAGNGFKSTINDDETCAEETKEMLAEEVGGKDSTTYRREFLCEFVTDSDLAIIPEWKEEFEREVSKDEYYQYYHRYVAMDLGVVDFTVALFGYYDFKMACLVVTDELSMRGPEMTTDKLAAALKEKEHVVWGEGSDAWDRKKVYLRVADNNNPLLLNDLGALHQIPFKPTDKDELEAMVNEARLLVKTGRVSVHPGCKQLIGCLRYGIYNSKKLKREFARSKVYGHYDALAAFIYLCRNLDTTTNPVPAMLGTHPTTHHIHAGAPQLQGTQAALSKIMGKQFTSRKVQ